jgi:hypothetical protein
VSNKSACIKLPIEKTGFPFYTSLWEIEKLSVPKISPYEENDKQNLGTEGTYSLRQLLTADYFEISKVKNKNADYNSS